MQIEKPIENMKIINVKEPAIYPERKLYSGKFITLTPINSNTDLHELSECSNGSEGKDKIWDYLSYGPFQNAEEMKTWMRECEQSEDPLFFTVRSKEMNKCVGVVSFLNIVLNHKTIELGHIWYSPEAQRTKINTETIYIMLTECFEKLNFRRVEWKCNSMNEKSKAAALRLGFSYEGTFLQHQISKSRNRDTAWYSMLDYEWETRKQNFKRCLYSNENISLTELNKPLLRKSF